MTDELTDAITDQVTEERADQVTEERADQESPDSPPPVPDDLVLATGLDHGTGVRRVFRGLDFSIPDASLAVVLGGDGSGKSLLLLALIGRAHPIGGSLQVAGLDAYAQAKQLRTITTAARIGTIVDLEPRHSVRDARRERTASEGLRRDAAERAYADACSVLELKPAEDALIEDLSRLHQTLLAVALACLNPSSLLVLDDADRGLNLQDQLQLYDALDRLIGATGTSVVVSSVEPTTVPEQATLIELPAGE